MLSTPLLAAPVPEQTQTIRPETFRLPRPGERDPYFGLCRTTYYDLEKEGALRLIRLRKRGYTRGTTLIPFDEIASYVRELRSTENA
jgi:hypothetical protein